MIPAHRYTVVPRIPDRLKELVRIAMNLAWTWDHEAIDLFRRLDPKQLLWERCYASPIKMLGLVSQERLVELTTDEGFLASLDRVSARLTSYLERPTWFDQAYPKHGLCVAYFCAEFGIVEGLRLYSGGLGILAGDHLKSASDLGIPLVAVGLMYRRGYFRQYLNADGWQQEQYPEADYYNLPIALERRSDGVPVTVEVEFPGRKVQAQVWRAQVGRVPLYLLDTDLEANGPEDRAITGYLYGGDRDMRIRQEILLGVGGIRALDTLGIEPTVCHLNEGHSAFLTLERIRRLIVRHKVGFAAAREVVAASNVFTTHTPVPAGIDVFTPDLMDRYFGPYYRQLGLSPDAFVGLGRQNPADGNEPFSMAVLAIRLSGATNGVSALHGRVSRRMWSGLWPGVPVDDLPITSITNGVHVRGWLSHDMAGLFDSYLGPRWISHPADHSIWDRVEQIPDAELWRTHERRRERLVAFARRRLRMQLEQRGAPPAEREQAEEVLDPKALTIGFARRFATYKRATLLFRDSERLARILGDPQRPVQIIYAGKAHPADQEGKDFIRQVVHFARRPEFRQRIVFLEDYDIKVGRYLYQGVDVWLNTPRRPLEASGTSGMKATVNGAINISVLDGWWDEAYDGTNGWAVGRGEEYDDPGYHDQVESQAIYQMLENEVVPMFYTRGRDGVPREWVRRMKNAMRTVCPIYSASRMVKEYTERLYLPAGQRWEVLGANGLERARALAAWRERVRANWKGVAVQSVDAEMVAALEAGTTRSVRAEITLGALTPKDVSVVLYAGPLSGEGEITSATVSEMKVEGSPRTGAYIYSGTLQGQTTGLHGFRVRILPAHEDLWNPVLHMNCIAWG
ncbi:MAG: alpha-glucan family phosphorylase [Candidatus Methylomirabilota bacterium]